MSAPEFESLESAFDYCREKNQPVRVIIEGYVWKLYPSGEAERLRAALKRERKEDG